MNWKSIRTCPEGVPVNTRLIDGYDERGAFGVRNEQRLVRRGRLFFCKDGIYVYYEPSEWCEL